MTYYSTCKQLSFGRTNFGRPTTKHDTTMLDYRSDRVDTKSIKTIKSNISKKSQTRHFDHLFSSSGSRFESVKITDEKSFKEALKQHFCGQKGAYRKFNNLLSKLKITSMKGDEVDIIIRLVDSLQGRKDLIEHLKFLLPGHCIIEMQKDALVLKVNSVDPTTNKTYTSVNLITLENCNNTSQ